MCVSKPLQLCKLNPGRKTCHRLVCWKHCSGQKIYIWGNIVLCFFRFLCIEERKWFWDSPENLFTPEARTITRTDLRRLWHTTLQPRASCLYWQLGKKLQLCSFCDFCRYFASLETCSHVLGMFVCLYRATFHTSCSVSKFLHAPKAQVNKQYLQPPPFPSTSQWCPSSSPWVPPSLSAALP